MAIIKEVNIDFTSGEVTVVVVFETGGTATLKHMPKVFGSDGGPELLDSAKTISGPTTDLLIFEDGQVVNKGAVPRFHKWDWSTKTFIDTRTSQEMWGEVVRTRNRLLVASDWTQLPDVPLSTKQAWITYRQALRDITLQSDPFNIVWPTPPN